MQTDIKTQDLQSLSVCGLFSTAHTPSSVSLSVGTAIRTSPEVDNAFHFPTDADSWCIKISGGAPLKQAVLTITLSVMDLQSQWKRMEIKPAAVEILFLVF